jgi:hypothetical protein
LSVLTAEKMHALREYTGEGLMNCRKALVVCNGDVLVACGYLRYQGSLVARPNYEQWLMGMAKTYSNDLVIGEDGKIRLLENRNSFSPTPEL